MQQVYFTLIQTDLFWEDKKANLAMLEEKIMGIKQKNTVVLLPEMFSTGFSMRPELFAEDMNGETVAWMRSIASSQKIILAGSIMVKEEDKYYNRLIWMQPDGRYACYDKRHLFAYGDEDKHYTPGNKRLITSVNGFKINMQICYDLRFPVWARQMPPADNPDNNFFHALIYVANWPERIIHHWKSLLVARAIENQCYVIGVNRVGDDGNNIHHSGESMVVNAMGEVLYHKKENEDVFTIALNMDHIAEIRSRLPFWKDADDFLIQ